MMEFQQALVLLKALQNTGCAFMIFGSFAKLLRGQTSVANDIDILVQPDTVNRVLQWLQDQGFTISAWDTIVTLPVDLKVSLTATDTRYYFRARRYDTHETYLQIDVLYQLAHDKWETLFERSMDVHGLRVMLADLVN